MDDAKCELVQNWLATADRDLTAARWLASGNDPLWDVAVYHCQQAGERLSKAGWCFTTGDSRRRMTSSIS